jgi:hypothetical protein
MTELPQNGNAAEPVLFRDAKLDELIIAHVFQGTHAVLRDHRVSNVQTTKFF